MINLKIIAPALGAAMAIGACNDEASKAQSHVRESVQAITEKNSQQQEIYSQQEAFEKWSKLEPLDTFIKKNPGKSFKFYYAQAENIDNDPTASIDDGGEQTQKGRILDTIRHDIGAGKYTLQDISMTSSSLEAQIQAEKKVIPIVAALESDEDGDDGFNPKDIPNKYLQAIDNGLNPE